MPAGLVRRYGYGDLHFLTFSCYRRMALLGTPFTRDVFVTVLKQMRQRYGFRLTGYVVMPNHVHLLIGEKASCTPSLLLKALKQVVSLKLRTFAADTASKKQSLRFSKNGDALSRFWQPRFYDFNIYSPGKIREKLEYMHLNPVKRGLVLSPGEWMWSSYWFYETGKQGLVEIDGF